MPPLAQNVYCVPPKVSVIMPAHNAEKYLSQAIESILNQTFKDFEFIIIDDGSTDRSLAIAKKYALKDSRIRILSKAHTGATKARNDGVSISKGEYLAAMDADDISISDRLEKEVRYLSEHKDVVCVGGFRDIIDKKGRFLTTLVLPTEHRDIDEMNLKGLCAIWQSCMMIKRESFNAIGGYSSDPLIMEDLDLCLKLAEIGKLHNLNSVLAKYRLLDESLSGILPEKRLQEIRHTCEMAWNRRGVKGICEATLWRPGKDRTSQYKYFLQYGWWAFNSEQTKTALINGFKAVKMMPFRLEGWKLIVVSIKKQILKLK